MESQESQPGSHYSQRECSTSVGVSRSAVQRIANDRGLRRFKRITAPQVEDGAVQRRLNRSQNLLTRFPRPMAPKSPDCNPLDYFFWDAVKRKVYEGRRERFQSLDQLKKRIRRVWKQACNLQTLRRAILQFRPRLLAVVKEKGGPIKTHFG